MANAPQPLKLNVEDYPDFDQETAQKLFPRLNQFFDEVQSGLSGKLTFGENFSAQFKTIDVAVVNSGGGGGGGLTGGGTDGNLAMWRNDPSPPHEAQVVDAVEEGWHLIGDPGEPTFQNGWVNY